MSTRRVLNIADGTAGVPPLIVCPRCEGQAYDVGSCAVCGNAGYLLADGAVRLPFVDQMQILATFSLATGIPLTAPPETARGE